MASYLWVMLGSALGGCLRYGITRWALSINTTLPWSTIGINVLGSFVIGFFGTLTLPGTRYAASGNMRLFVMVGICGGFTTFSSFSLQTFDLLRSESWWRGFVNVGLSVLMCLGAVALGHALAQRSNGQHGSVQSVARTSEEKHSG